MNTKAPALPNGDPAMNVIATGLQLLTILMCLHNIGIYLNWVPSPVLQATFSLDCMTFLLAFVALAVWMVSRGDTAMSRLKSQSVILDRAIRFSSCVTYFAVAIATAHGIVVLWGIMHQK